MTLIVRTPNWLGDLVMSIPAISMLFAEYPNLSLWSHKRVSGLIPVFFPSIKTYEGERINGESFTKLLLMTDSFRSAFQGFLSGIPERIGHKTDMRGLFLTKKIMPPTDRHHHHSADYEALALAAGATGNALALEPAVKAAGIPHTAYFTGARYGSAKMWLRFPELAGRIYESTGLPSVFYGSPEEDVSLRNISSVVPLSKVRTDLSLPELASNLLSAELSIGNDSGGVHVSAALGIPTVTVFGSTSPVWTAPMGKFTATVNAELECSPCFKRECPEGIPQCMSNISTDEVFTACIELTKRAGKSDG